MMIEMTSGFAWLGAILTAVFLVKLFVDYFSLDGIQQGGQERGNMKRSLMNQHIAPRCLSLPC